MGLLCALALCSPVFLDMSLRAPLPRFPWFNNAGGTVKTKGFLGSAKKA